MEIFRQFTAKKKGHRKKERTQSKNFNFKKTKQESVFLHWMPISLGFLIGIYGGLHYRKCGKNKEDRVIVKSSLFNKVLKSALSEKAGIKFDSLLPSKFTCNMSLLYYKHQK